MDDHHFRQLLNYFEFSWAGYRKVRKGVKKRISRHMNHLGCRSMTAYLAKVDSDPAVRQQCELLMTVSISRFFRDGKFWCSLEKKLLPKLIAIHTEELKVWSAGCAGGDEVYTFMIVWDFLKKKDIHLPGLKVLATDMDPDHLDRARSGIYRASSLKDVSPEIVSLYFKEIAGKKVYVIKEWLGKEVIWKIHHLLSDPPGSNFNLIFLRNNILTYYEDRLKKEAFEKILASLAPLGLLIIGSHEVLPLETTELVRVAPYPFVYKKS